MYTTQYNVAENEHSCWCQTNVVFELCTSRPRQGGIHPSSNSTPTPTYVEGLMQICCSFSYVVTRTVR